jgi:hypothetical protein
MRQAKPAMLTEVDMRDDLHFFDGCRTSTGPVTFTLPATDAATIAG